MLWELLCPVAAMVEQSGLFPFSLHHREDEQRRVQKISTTFFTYGLSVEPHYNMMVSIMLSSSVHGVRLARVAPQASEVYSRIELHLAEDLGSELSPLTHLSCQHSNKNNASRNCSGHG